MTLWHHAGMSSPSLNRPAGETLSDTGLVASLAAGALAVVAFFAVRPWLPAAFKAPGTPVMQAAAILAALLFLVPVLFAVNKRTGAAGRSPRWFSAHVGAATLGAVLAAIHSTGNLDDPPVLLLLAIAGLVVTGAVARVYLSRDMAGTFGTKRNAFRAPDEGTRAELRRLIEEKQALLKTLDPDAIEATFSVTLRHFLSSPCRAAAYKKLQRRESRLMGARASVGAAQAWWRPLHIALGWLFVLGLLIHILTVTFFAGYVADGREIYWWHITAW